LSHSAGDVNCIQSQRELQNHLNLRAVVEKDVAGGTDIYISAGDRRDHVVGMSGCGSLRSGGRPTGRLSACRVPGLGKFNDITVCEDKFREMNLKLRVR
jgi:hypothetical protein